MTVTGSIRLLVGGALLAAGGQLAAPLATRLVAAARQPAPAAVGQTPVADAGQPPPPSAPPQAGVDGWGAPDTQPPDVQPVPAPSDGPTTDGTAWLQLDRGPPPPPAALPPVPEALEQAGPALGPAYRSTLRVPPPDLLDAAGPPPVRPWDAPAVATRGDAVPVPSLFATDVTVPATYRVRDGDDLGTIAGRFYGQPAAAAAIWAANRTTIPDPNLLPIGAELTLPPPWAVSGPRHAPSGTIEPAAFARPSAAPAGTTAAVTGADPWLPADRRPAVASPRQPVAPAGGQAASSVRVGPGETLPSLARRLYGDPAMADQIFAANRDRLRSPDLVVPGMELRLPRPVTAPPT